MSALMRPDIDRLIGQAEGAIAQNKMMIAECEYKKQQHRELISACELLALEVQRLHRVVNAMGGLMR
jgi:hypothetical protein